MKTLLISFLLILLPCLAIAAPAIIGTYGKTYPIAPYTKNTFQTPKNLNITEDQMQIKTPQNSRINMFPVITKTMTPGKVLSRKIKETKFALNKPIFLIGSGDQSQAWLKKYLPRLQQIKAIGLLVQANNKEGFKKMQSLAAGITLIPVSGDVLGQKLGIKHYPVLISKSLIEQ